MLDQAWFGWISHNSRIEYIRERVHLNLDLNSGEKYIIWLENFLTFFPSLSLPPTSRVVFNMQEKYVTGRNAC